MTMLRHAAPMTLSLWLLAASAVQADQQSTLSVGGRKTAATAVRVSCAAQWRDMTANVRLASGGYAKFLDRCLARATPSAKTAGNVIYVNYVEDAGIPQLTELGVIAAPGVGAAAATGGGVSTGVIVGSAVVVAGAAAGVAAASGSADKPASP